MFRVLSLFQADPDGYPLHHFHVVAGRVLRREQAELRTAGTGHAFHQTFEILIEGIHVDGHPLFGAHLLQLGFLEICRHPEVGNGNIGHQLLARRDLLPGFGVLSADDAVHRSEDLRVREIQLRLIEHSLLFGGRGLADMHQGVLQQDLLRPVLFGFHFVHLSLPQLRLGSLHVAGGSLHVAGGGFGAGLAGVRHGGHGFCGGLHLVVLQFADLVFGNELLITGEIRLGLHLVGLGLTDLGKDRLVVPLRRGRLSLGCGHLRQCPGNVRLVAGNGCIGGGGSDADVGADCRHLRAGLIERSGRLGDS